MRELIECFNDWLAKHREDAGAYSLLVALTQETLKKADSPLAALREFDAQDLAAAAGRPEADDFDASKRWVVARKLETFAEARCESIEGHFRTAGHDQCLRPARRSPAGKHRAVWFLDPYPLPADSLEAGSADPPQLAPPNQRQASLRYEFTPPGKVRPAWYARPMFGAGSFVTRSWRGLLWASVFILAVLFVTGSALLALGHTQMRRPLLTSDLASLVMLGVVAWAIWRLFVRPMVWLLEDKIVPATESWLAWSEDTAQLELTKDESNRRHLQLVRYSAVCPLCAGTVELRYSQGPNTRRLVGCCNEAPHDHIFSFDRISGRGSRIVDVSSDNSRHQEVMNL